MFLSSDPGSRFQYAKYMPGFSLHCCIVARGTVVNKLARCSVSRYAAPFLNTNMPVLRVVNNNIRDGYKEVLSMTITIGGLIIMLLISLLVGLVGELIARRRTPFGIVGATLLGFLAILLVTGVFHWHIDGEPYLNGVPLITSVLVAIVLVLLWSAFAYRHAYGYYRRRPRRRYY
jgi:uncharacterized membrane protein YeaQ/YmgE (transglycosylase-associated protein family)